MSDCGHGALVASGEARGLCPLCQQAEIERLRADLSGRDADAERFHTKWTKAETEIERLKAELARIRGLPRLAALDDEIARLTAENAELRVEIERLRALVRSAYAEGFSEGINEHTKFRGGKPWEDSRACRALEGK